MRVQGASLSQGTFARIGTIPTVVSRLRLDWFICASFGVFQAKESIEQLVYVCRTDKEEVREAAKQALLVLGEADFIPDSILTPLTAELHHRHHPCVCVLITCVDVAEQVKRVRWPTDTWKLPKTAFPDSSQQEAWPAPRSDVHGPASISAPPTLSPKSQHNDRCHDNHVSLLPARVSATRTTLLM